MKQRSNEYDLLARYLEAVHRFPPLTRAEEHALAVRARSGDTAAGQKLARHNLAFVVSFARQQKLGSVRLEDVIQEGNLGMLRAVQKFDPNAGTRFTTYALWWIRAYVWRYLREARSAVRRQAGATALADLSLDDPIGDEQEVTRLDRLADAGPGPEERFARLEREREIRDALGRVRRRIGAMGWEIVHERLAQEPPRTLEEIGKRWGVSRERVRQVELGTKQFLRRYLDPEEGASGSPLGAPGIHIAQHRALRPSRDANLERPCRRPRPIPSRRRLRAAAIVASR
jgi:RNA polymerase primary sigma factor